MYVQIKKLICAGIKTVFYRGLLPLAPKLKCKLFTKSNSTMHAFVLNLDNICTSNLSVFL